MVTCSSLGYQLPFTGRNLSTFYHGKGVIFYRTYFLFLSAAVIQLNFLNLTVNYYIYLFNTKSRNNKLGLQYTAFIKGGI